jgi:hypothetical protein
MGGKQSKMEICHVQRPKVEPGKEKWSFCAFNLMFAEAMEATFLRLNNRVREKREREKEDVF